MRPRHGDELPRSIEPDGFVPQASKVTEIPAGSATEIKDRIWRIALYRIEECRVILADIVVPRTVPEGAREPVVIREGRFAEATDLFRRVKRGGAFHLRSIFPICAEPAHVARYVLNRSLRRRSKPSIALRIATAASLSASSRSTRLRPAKRRAS